MAGQTKPNKLQPRLPRGFADRGPEDIRAVERMMATIKRVYERYGFEPVETPFVEYTDALGKFLPDQDRPNEGVFSFQDEDEQWLSLRYDLTAPLARYVAQNYEALPKPYRSYRAGWVFRNEKPGPGRFRQFMQFDADTVGTAREGASSAAADAEICMMAADTIEALGFERGQYVIRVNSRKLLDGVMEALSIPAGRRIEVFRSIDAFDRIGSTGVRDRLGAGRTDESGARTEGVGLDEVQIDGIFGLMFHTPALVPNVNDPENSDLQYSNARVLAHLQGFASASRTLEAGVEELTEIADLTASAGYRDDRIQISTSVVRGLEYYTGPVFEAQLTFEVPNEKGEPVVFGSVGGGGRYDGLVGRFRGEDVPATGFSVGVSRLAAALTAVGKLGQEGASGPVVVTVMDRARLPEYQKIVAELRDGLNRDRKPDEPVVPVEMYLGGSGMKAQLKYADRRNAPCAIIAGSDEFDKGRLQVKDLAAGKEQAAAIADNRTWREERPGQFEVARDELVAKVRELLERQKAG
jgi:histidyl-tRNA synthetase